MQSKIIKAIKSTYYWLWVIP